MGLDMMLNGRKSSFRNNEYEDGFLVTSKNYEIGYWRKHPNLHGFIVNTKQIVFITKDS